MRAHVVALVVLWLLALVVRIDATEARTSAGHGDVAAYYQVSRNLYEGRGFEQDFIADRLADPSGLPTPSNTWWRPLPSVLGWLGMAAAGDASYAAGKRAMILVSSFVPWVAYLAGWLLLRTRAAAFAAGLLAVGFHLFLDQPNQILSHGPYALFGGGALVLSLGIERSTKYLPWFGVLFGLAFLSRGDAQGLPLVLAASILAARFVGERRPIPWRGLAAAVGLFVVVVAPWWARNVGIYGALMPPGVSKVAFATTYEDWFSDPDGLTWENYRDWGVGNILDQKRHSVTDAVSFVPFCMSESVDRDREVEPGEPVRRLHVLGRYVLGPLLWVGFAWLLWARRRAALLVLLQLALLVGIYGVVFSAIGRNSFHSSLFSVYPVFLVCVVAAIELLLRPLLRERATARAVATVSIAALLCALNVWAARPHLAAKYAGIEAMLAPYRALGAWAAAEGLDAPVFYCRYPWQLSTEARVGAVMIPNDDAGEIRRVAETFGVTHLVDETVDPADLLRLRPGLAELLESGELERAPVDPGGLRLYRLLPRHP
jgi:hypothetical protein